MNPISKIGVCLFTALAAAHVMGWELRALGDDVLRHAGEMRRVTRAAAAGMRDVMRSEAGWPS